MVMFSGLITLVLLKPLPWMVMLSLGLCFVPGKGETGRLYRYLGGGVGSLLAAPCALYLDNALDGVATNGGRHHEGNAN